MTPSDRLQQKLAIVDDSPSARLGVEALLHSGCPDIAVTTLDFLEARELQDWTGFDYVLVDLAQPSHDDEHISEYPGIGCVKHIRERASGRGPWIIVITGQSASFEEPLVMHQLAEVGADYFIERTYLDDKFRSIFAATRAPDIPNTFAAKKVGDPARGVWPYSSATQALDFIEKYALHKRHPKAGAGSDSPRQMLFRAFNISGVNAQGRILNAKPRWANVEELWQKGRRIPRRGDRRRGNGGDEGLA